MFMMLLHLHVNLKAAADDDYDDDNDDDDDDDDFYLVIVIYCEFFFSGMKILKTLQV